MTVTPIRRDPILAAYYAAKVHGRNPLYAALVQMRRQNRTEDEMRTLVAEMRAFEQRMLADKLSAKLRT